MSDLRLTNTGLQAIQNANAGGVLIDPVLFKIGTSNIAFDASQVDIQGQTIYTGAINFVEVLDQHVARFTLDIPKDIGGTQGIDIFEVAVFLTDNIMLGRAVLDAPIPKTAGAMYRLTVLLVSSECDLTTINVTIGDYSSIPSTPQVTTLPNPVSSMFNVVSVLSGKHNSDGTDSPILAMRYGPGGQYWSFTGHDKIYSGAPDSNNVSTTTFKRTSLSQAFSFHDGEVVVVQVISGPGAGETRRFYYDEQLDIFREFDGTPFSALSDSSFIAIWRKIENGSGSGGISSPCPWPPDGTGIPSNWVLTRGVSCPVWAPPASGNAGAVLYVPPGRFRPVVLTSVGSGLASDYTFAGMDIQDTRNTLVSLQGAVQHKTAYDFKGDTLRFAEKVPASVNMDIRVFSKEAGSGTRLTVVTDTFICDGNKRNFKLSRAIEGVEFCLVWLAGIFQHITSYTYNSQTQEIVFTEAPVAGRELEISLLVRENIGGYSTKTIVSQYRTTAPTQQLDLPITPESKDYVFVSMSGFHIHKSRYSLVGNKVLLLDAIRAGLEVEVFIFQNIQAVGTENNNLSGVVVDATVSSSSIRLLRHNALPVDLPLPTIGIKGKNGIKVSGSYPQFVIESDIAESLSKESINRASIFKASEDTEELIYTHRFEFKKDMVVVVNVDFSAILGKGFSRETGLERVEYVVGMRGPTLREPDYGKRIQGTGTAGFSIIEAGVNTRAYSNASMTQTFVLIKANNPSGHVDFVARMKVFDAKISSYGSILTVNFNMLNLPLLEL